MTVSAQVIEVLDALCGKMGIVIDWTSENVIPYIVELAGKYIKFEIATSTTLLVVSIAFLISGWKFSLWAHKKVDDVECSIVVFVGMLFATIAFFAIIGQQIFDIIKCITIPELILFEKVQMIMQ